MIVLTLRVLAAGSIVALLGGCGILGPAPMPTQAASPLAGAETVGTTTILPVDAPPGLNLWMARKNETAEAMLNRWAGAAGFSVQWEAGSDNPVKANAAIAAPFADAVTVAFNEGWPDVTPKLRPHIHTENNVIVVSQDTP